MTLHKAAPYPEDTRYWVTTEGHVYSTCTNRWLKPGRMNRFGHVSVAIGRGNSKCVHYLVLRTFIGPRPDGCDVAHENGVGGDNRLCNLAYKTRSENNKDMARHGKRRFTQGQIQELRARHAGGATGRALAAEHGYSEAGMSQILRGETYATQ